MAHSIEKKVYYHDTDAGGVVYYGNYLKFLEEGRTEYCISRGVDIAGLFAGGISFVVVHVEVDYVSSARYGDVLAVETEVDKVGTSSVRFSQRIKRGEQLLVRSAVVWACVNRDFKAIPVSGDIRNALLAPQLSKERE